MVITFSGHCVIISTGYIFLKALFILLIAKIFKKYRKTFGTQHLKKLIAMKKKKEKNYRQNPQAEKTNNDKYLSGIRHLRLIHSSPIIKDLRP